MNRAGSVLDYPILIVSQHPKDPGAFEKYTAFAYIAKSTANFIPGTLFADAKLNTSRVFGIIYRGDTEKDVMARPYVSEYWTMWGITFVEFGVVGGLLSIFAAGILMQLVFNGIGGDKPRAQRYKAWFLFVILLHALNTMGVDHMIATIAILFVQALIMRSILLGLSRVFSSERIAMGHARRSWLARKRG
jgi:hypothetical protein